MQSFIACGEISIGWPGWEYRNSPDRQCRRTAYTVVHSSTAASGMVNKFLILGLGDCCGVCFLDTGPPFGRSQVLGFGLRLSLQRTADRRFAAAAALESRMPPSALIGRFCFVAVNPTSRQPRSNQGPFATNRSSR